MEDIKMNCLIKQGPGLCMILMSVLFLMTSCGPSLREQRENAEARINRYVQTNEGMIRAIETTGSITPDGNYNSENFQYAKNQNKVLADRVKKCESMKCIDEVENEIQNLGKMLNAEMDSVKSRLRH
jgi:hypothetical protein